MVLCLLSESGVKSAVHISHASNVQIGSGNVMIVNAAHRKRSAKSQPRPEPMITGKTIYILNAQSHSHLNDTRLHNKNLIYSKPRLSRIQVD